jgi:hypothetical protein
MSEDARLPGCVRREAMWARSGFAVVAAISMLTVGACGGAGGEQTKSADDVASPDREIRQTVDTFYRAQEGDLGLYKSALCTKKVDELKDVTGSQFATQSRQAVDKDGRFIVDWFDEIKISNGSAEVAFTGHSLGGISPDIGDQHETAKVVLENGSWKVCELPQPDVVTKRKLEQLVDRTAIQNTVVTFAASMSLGIMPTAQVVDRAECTRTVSGFLRRYGNILAGSAITSIQEIYVNQDAAKAKYTVDTAEESVPLGVALDREGDTWRICVVELIGQTTLKR